MRTIISKVLTLERKVERLGTGESAVPKPFKRAFGHQQDAGLTTYSNIGVAASPTTYGASVALRQDASGQYLTYTSVAATSQKAGWVSSAYSLVTRRDKPVFYATIETGGALNAVKMWVGLASQLQNAAAAGHCAFIRYSTAQSTSAWRVITRDNSTTKVTNTTSAVATATRYEMKVDCSSTDRVSFFANGQLIGQSTASLPGSTAGLGWQCHARAGGSSARQMRISRVWIEHE